jgi:hypothetical protein
LRKLRKNSEQVKMVAFEPIGGWNLEGEYILKKIAVRVAMEVSWRKKRSQLRIFMIVTFY